LNPRRQSGFEIIQDGLYRGGDLQRGLLADPEDFDFHRGLAVEPGMESGFLKPVFDMGQIRQPGKPPYPNPLDGEKALPPPYSDWW